MKSHKRPSHRIKLSKLHKAEKLARRNKSQKRRQERKTPDGRKKMKKDLGVPNLWPFKDELLRKIEARKEEEELAALREKEERLAQAKKVLREMEQENNTDNTAVDMAEAEDPLSRVISLDGNANDDKYDAEDDKGVSKDMSKRQFMKKFRKVIEAADVILEVVDARDPNSCRVKEAERLVKSSGGKKRLVIVMNKVDLVPHDVLDAWVRYLRDEFPTIAFKASTQRGAPSQGDVNLRRASESAVAATSEALGAEALLQLLKNYCREGGSESAAGKSITVGVVGYPNVGKSSVINSLKRARAVGVSPVPGFTREISEVKLDRSIRLLDSPGVFFYEGSDALDEASVAAQAPVLLNCLRAESLVPEKAVELLLERAPHDTLLEVYKIGDWTSTREFLSRVAQRRGKLKRGGIPDVEVAAKLVVADVGSGRIPYWTEPPVREGVHLGAEIKDSFDQSLTLPEVVNSSNKKVVAAKKPVQDDMDIDDDGEEDEEDDDDEM